MKTEEAEIKWDSLFAVQAISLNSAIFIFHVFRVAWTLIAGRSAEGAGLFGHTLSLGKTEVLHHPAPGSSAPPPSICIDIKQLISSDGSMDREIGKASQALAGLQVRVLLHQNIKLSTKLKIDKTGVTVRPAVHMRIMGPRQGAHQATRNFMRSLRFIVCVRG
ncbi:hypothetical protein BaRGS_00004855 [Batillaria attramentaria]|uniref:Uncharacterized protein n=1 Tax=Batillaria attramentaria TaxID=370345 RepID=A0ABD0LW49_9CAEN